MQSPASRKLRERHLLDRFLAVAEIEARSVVDAEAPDFVLEHSGHRIGVELTELFRPANGGAIPPRAQETLTNRIVSAAKTVYESTGSAPVHVTVAFFEGVDVRSIRRDTVAERLARLVRELLPESGTHTNWRNDYEDQDLDPVAFVSAIRVPDQSMANWSVARAGWRASLPENLISDAIHVKNKKLPSYRSDLEEVWLVLAIEGSRPSQFFELSSLPYLGLLVSHFDRTYLFSSFAARVLQWSKPK
jgi:hypothetical protein